MFAVGGTGAIAAAAREDVEELHGVTGGDAHISEEIGSHGQQHVLQMGALL